MLLEKDKYCSCPNCGCKSFRDISVINIRIVKNEWNDDMLIPTPERDRYKCTRCGKEFSSGELYEHYKGE